MDTQTVLRSPTLQLFAEMASEGGSQHPSFGHLTLQVFEAVVEVVCVSLPGYIVARRGMFDSGAQKFIANLNMTLFTPCLSMKSTPRFGSSEY